jgi:hypothetical protein
MIISAMRCMPIKRGENNDHYCDGHGGDNAPLEILKGAPELSANAG